MIRDLYLSIVLAIAIVYQNSITTVCKETDLQVHLKLSDDFLRVQEVVDGFPLLSQNRRGRDSSVGIGRA